MYNKIVGFCLFLFFLSTEGVGAGMDSYEIETIADGLLAAEAQFTNLTLNYVTKAPVSKNNIRAWSFDITEGAYTQKLPQKMQRLDSKVFRIESKTGKRTLLNEQLSSFNGDTTVRLDKNTGSNLMRASIHKGYKPKFFPRHTCPDNFIWRWGGKSLATVIKENKETFYIESKSEIVDGVPTIKLVGTVIDGKGLLKLWISRDRNFLPLKSQVVRNRDNQLLSETRLLNLTELPDGLWYPKRIQTGDPDPNFAVVCNISKISTEPIPEKFFTPEIPVGTYIYDYVIGVAYTNLDPEDLGLHSIEQDGNSIQQNPDTAQKTLDDYVKKAEKAASEVNSIIRENEKNNVDLQPLLAMEKIASNTSKPTSNRSYKVMALILGVGVIIAIVAWLYWKRMR